MAERAPRPPIVLRIRREAAYAALMVALLLGGAELFFRLRDAATDAKRGARPYSIRSVTHDGVAYADDDGAIRLANDPELLYKPLGPQPGDVVTLNRDGFRSAVDWSCAKPAGTRRVVVFGGSAAFGVNASGDARTFAALLGARLDAAARASGGRVEVWNCGVIGWESTQELALLAHRIVDAAPDAIVLFDGWNDFHGSGLAADATSALLHVKFAENDRYLARREEPLLELLRRSKLASAIESGLQRIVRKATPNGELGEYHDHSDVAVPRFARNLRAMVRLARSYGAATVVAPQPELFARANPPPEEQRFRAKREKEGYGAYARLAYPRFVAAARAVADEEKALFVDATKAFDATDELAFTDFVHFNDRGNEFVADALEPALRAALGLAAKK